MERLSIIEAKEKLDQLIALVAKGEHVTIAAPGGGTVRLLFEPSMSATGRKKRRQAGRFKGLLKVPENLLEPMSNEELRHWYGDDS